MRRVIIVVAALLFLPTIAAAQELPGNGTLTVIVRDDTGARLPGITLALFQDTDLDGRMLITTTTTDQAGQALFPDLPWGLYIVQFQGRAPDGRLILPPAQQNLGALEDGTGVSNGFGVRFAEATRTELYVLGTVNGEARAVPMFDMAPSVADPPQRYDPIVELENAGPTPTPFLLRDVVEGRLDSSGQPIRRGRLDGWCLAGIGMLILSIAVLIAVGWWRSRRLSAPHAKETPDARVDG
jgi:hypothetical protein